MKTHLNRFWLHYFVLAICVFFIVKLYSDNKGGGKSKGTPPSELDYTKVLTTGTNSPEVKAAQAYVNSNIDNQQVQGNPLSEDGILGVNSTMIFELLKFCPVGVGQFSPSGSVSITLNEVIALTDSYNCG